MIFCNSAFETCALWYRYSQGSVQDRTYEHALAWLCECRQTRAIYTPHWVLGNGHHFTPAVDSTVLPLVKAVIT